MYSLLCKLDRLKNAHYLSIVLKRSSLHKRAKTQSYKTLFDVIKDSIGST